MTVHFTPRGLPVSTISAELAAALHCFEEEILDYGCNAALLFDALSLDPECALAAAYAAALHLFRSTREGHAKAKELITLATRLPSGTTRENAVVAAIASWADDDVAGAAHLLGQCVLADPADLFALKLQQHLLFSTGRTKAMLSSIAAIAAATPDEARVLGMFAFALDQAGQAAEAERVARTALSIAPDPWAHHALAHALDAQERHTEGCSWMRMHADAWVNCTSFLYTHNWWHAALFHLGLGDRDGALALYHERVWAKRKDYVQDQVNAVSLLARLELAGVDVGDRWEDVAAYIRPRQSDAIDGFLDLHYAYALARAGDDASIAILLRAKQDKLDGSRAREVGLIAASGIAAIGFGDDEKGANLLQSVQDDLPLLGGSTVQRRLFADLLLAERITGSSLTGRAA